MGQLDENGDPQVYVFGKAVLTSRVLPVIIMHWLLLVRLFLYMCWCNVYCIARFWYQQYWYWMGLVADAFPAYLVGTYYIYCWYQIETELGLQPGDCNLDVPTHPLSIVENFSPTPVRNYIWCSGFVCAMMHQITRFPVICYWHYKFKLHWIWKFLTA